MNQIEEYTDRPRRYFNIDGLGEVGMGLMFLAFGLIGWLWVSLPRDSFWSGGFISFSLLVLPMLLIIYYGTKILKKRVTYRRTGFVEYGDVKGLVFFPYAPGSLTRLLMFLVVLFGLVALTAFYPQIWNPFLRPGFNFASMTCLYGIMLAIVYAAKIAGRIRWKWGVAVLLACGSIMISMFFTSMDEAAPWWFGFYGLTFLISGGISFYLYLKHTEPAARAAE